MRRAIQAQTSGSNAKNVRARADKREVREAVWNEAVAIANERVELPLREYIVRIYKGILRKKKRKAQ